MPKRVQYNTFEEGINMNLGGFGSKAKEEMFQKILDKMDEMAKSILPTLETDGNMQEVKTDTKNTQ